MARETLNREKVLDAALRLVQEQGIGNLSMRKLAGQLGVEAMSLYNHVANKADLLDGMEARIFETVAVPDPALSWDSRVRLLAEGLYGSFTRHPAVLRALAAEEANPRSVGALKVIDALMKALLDAGLDEYGAVRGYRSILGTVFGAVLTDTVDATGVDTNRAVPIGVWFTTNVTEAEMPSLHRVLPALGRADCVQDFTFQVDLLIAGLRTAAATSTSSATDELAQRPGSTPG